MAKKTGIVLLLIIIFALLVTFILSTIAADKGKELTLINSKTLISPGNLVKFDAFQRDLFVAHNHSGQIIISKFNAKGTKQWNNVYSSSRLLIDSSPRDIIVGDLGNETINILDIHGKKHHSWKSSGKPLYCSISNDGRNFVASESRTDQTSWEVSLELKDNDGKELFTIKYDNIEVVNVEWSPIGIAVLAFSFNKDTPGQYLYVYDNYGKELYIKKFEDQVYDFDLSPSGNHLAYATKNEVGLYNLLVDSLTILDFEKIVGLGFSSEDRIFLLENSISLLTFGKQVKLREISTSGQVYGVNKYKGELQNYYIGFDGTIALVTKNGVYLSNNLVGYSFKEINNIDRVALDEDFTVYISKNGNTIEWYK